MPVIDNSKHEQFAQLIVKGVCATKAYTSAGYSAKGAQQSGARLLLNAQVCSRIRELQEAISAETIVLEISTRNARVAALQKRWDRLRSGLDLILDQRGAEMAHISGGGSGMLCVDYKGKEADVPVVRIDPGIVAVVAELRAHEKQAAEELEQWKTHIEVRKTVDASLAAITLGMILTREQLLAMKRKALELEQELAEA
jgi:Terminase small subunit